MLYGDKHLNESTKRWLVFIVGSRFKNYNSVLVFDLTVFDIRNLLMDFLNHVERTRFVLLWSACDPFIAADLL